METLPLASNLRGEVRIIEENLIKYVENATPEQLDRRVPNNETLVD